MIWKTGRQRGWEAGVWVGGRESTWMGAGALFLTRPPSLPPPDMSAAGYR